MYTESYFCILFNKILSFFLLELEFIFCVLSLLLYISVLLLILLWFLCPESTCACVHSFILAIPQIVSVFCSSCTQPFYFTLGCSAEHHNAAWVSVGCPNGRL